MRNLVLNPPYPSDPDRAVPQKGASIFVSRNRVRQFGAPLDIVTASRVEDVLPALRRVEERVAAGCTAAGFVAYEAAPAFDEALRCRGLHGFPLVWFALYEAEDAAPPRLDGAASEPADGLDWRSLVPRREYEAALSRIRDYIAAGDTYQVNLTYPLEAACGESSLGLFRSLLANQGTDYGAYLDAGGFQILSVSPELFFHLDGERVTTRPMKGTASRGLWYEDDCARAEALRASEKERAENVMIVDMVRNDLGRIARTGSVRVESLFDVERYDTVWQMTSTVAAETEASVPEIFQALFPSASVTGAPKVRTMEIIRELEAYPRGVYCGAIGWWGPGRQAEFSVGIRTVTVDSVRRAARYHVGSGITWDSVSDAEYEECRLKADVLSRPRRAFKLLESVLWDDGYFLLAEHLDRLERSAAYFGIPVVRDELMRELDTFASGLTGARKVRLLVSQDGSVGLEAEGVKPRKVNRAGLAPEPVDRAIPFLYHKTTQRDVYERMRLLRPDWDDVLLWNSEGELTESTVANIAVRLNGRWYTPPIASGLLGGVMRRHLLEAGVIEESVLPVAVLAEAEGIKLINSVRGWIDVELVPSPDACASEEFA